MIINQMATDGRKQVDGFMGEYDNYDVSSNGDMTVTEARLIAVEAHADQRDRDGSFHIHHVSRVAEKCNRAPYYQRVAWLHDVLEDVEDSENIDLGGLPNDERDALEHLTRHEGETYMDYIDNIAKAEGRAGAIARAVKRADLNDNLARCIRRKDPAMERYARAIVLLERGGRD